MYFGLATVVFFILFGVTTPPANESAVNSEQIKLENEDQIEKEEEQAKKEAEEQAKKEAEEQAKLEAETMSQQQAVKMAEDYLDYTAFSKSGLIEQLVF